MTDDRQRPPAELLATWDDGEPLSESERLVAWTVHQAVTELFKARGKEPPADSRRSVIWAATQWLGELKEARRRARIQ